MRTQPTINDCVNVAISAGVDEGSAREIVQELLSKKERMLAEGRLDNLERELAESWMQKMDEQRVAALLQRKQAAINILRRSEIDNFLAQVEKQGFSFMDGLEALMVGSFKRFFGARNSVAAKRQGIQKYWQGGMLNELDRLSEKHDVNLTKLFSRDKAFHDNVVAEMFTPESTGNALARETADLFSRHLEQTRLRLNAAGANIGKLEGYVPQSHDPFKMGKKSKANGNARSEWVTFIKERLDIERSFPDLANDAPALEEALLKTYNTIITNGDAHVSAFEKGQSLGPRNLASSYGQHRKLHFKDAKAFIEYNETYGRGNIVDTMWRHLENSARMTSLMETFGTNPQNMIDSLVATKKRKLAENTSMDPQAQINELEKLDNALMTGSIRGGKITYWLAELTGESSWAGHLGAARVMSVARATQAMAKLGAATLSSLADPFIKASAMRVAGLSWPEAVTRSITQYFVSYSGDKKRLARELGFLTEGILGDMRIRWDVNEALPGKMADLQNKFFKWSGLNWITESGKAGYATWFSRHMGDVSKINFNDLDASRRALLEYHGINGDKWEAMRHMVEKASDGNSYFVPRLAGNLGDADLEKFLPDNLLSPPSDIGKMEQWQNMRQKEFGRLRQELESQAASMIADEALFAVLEPDEKTRAAMFRGTRPGTVEGEVLRSIWQFKSFPMSYAQRVLGGRRWVKGELQAGMAHGWLNPNTYKDAILRDVPGVVGFAVSSYLFGYMAMVLKDLSKGKKPRDPHKQETIIAAVMQSGGLGIVGDFMFGKVDRFGNGFASSLVGPLGGVVGNMGTIAGEAIRGDFKNAAEDSLRVAMSNTPFVNLWYTRAALDWLVLYHLREWISPGALEREAKRMQDEFGQEFIVKPSSKIKKGGGFK